MSDSNIYQDWGERRSGGKELRNAGGGVVGVDGG